MMPIRFSRVLLLSVLVPISHGCYQRDLHHELPCAITIDQPQVTKSPSGPLSPVPPTLAPSIQGAAHSQTLLPTAIITIVFSPAPIIVPPSASPTTLPLTASPVALLTLTPITRLSTSPTVTPFAPPTATPVTIAPTPSPTALPTTKLTNSPSPALTSKPTKANCQANKNGFFGGISGNPNLVSYGYELETTPISQSTLQNEVLPALKDGFVNSLLPDLFSNQCAGGTRRLQGVRRFLQILGISARPDDVPLSNSTSCFLESCA